MASLTTQPARVTTAPTRRESTVGNSNRKRIPYEAGLDGLRALAVTGVFLYHANVSWMPGGFLGVDLFFVLSGYLITSLLLREFSERGTIQMRAFWGRRARRLFPAVAVVILFALLATMTIARDDLARTRADALSALVYLTNWHEIIASHSYFNQFGRPSLLLHLWSLAVEEQFYLLWPLLIIVGLRCLRRGGTAVLTVLLAVGSCALMWTTYSPSGDPSRVYYGTDTRAFTLLAGAFVAFAWPVGRTAFRHRRGTGVAAEAIGLAALIGVLVLFWRVQDFDPWLYRGGFLLMAVVAAVLVVAVSRPGSVLGRLLGCRPMRWLGARSYGIYLWHWPIMQLTRPGIDVGWHGAPLILAQAAATVGAAALSYRYIEMPIRSGQAQRRLRHWLNQYTPRERLAWALAAVGVILGTAGLAFGLPAPPAAIAFSTKATPSALQTLTRATPTSLAVAATSPAVAAREFGGTRPAGVRGQRTPGAAMYQNRSVLPSGPILALGDSVMLGCAPNLEQRLGRRLRVDAVVGRQAEATIDRIAQYRAAGQLPSTVVVQIGDNGPVWYADMQHLRRVLRGVPRVVLVNVRLARSWQNEVNHELKSYARTWPQAVVANWYTHSSQAMLTDGVHPSVAARATYARVVVDALEKSERASSS